jgi:WD40 repeat protein
VRILDRFDHPLRCLAYSPDGKLLAVGDEGATTLWSLPAGEPAGTLQFSDSPASTEALAFSPDGTRLVVGLPGGVLLWEDLPGTLNHARGVPCEGGVRGLAWSPDGRLFVSSGWHPRLWFWTHDLCTRADPLQTTAPVTCLAFVADGNTLAGGTSQGGLLFWAPDRATRWKQTTSRQSPRPIFSLAATPDGRLLAAGHDDGAITLWDSASRESIATLAGHEWVVYGLGFTPDGQRLVSGSADGTVRLWDVPGRRPVATYRWHESWITAVAVSPDGMTAASAGNDGKVVVWDLADA